jgi:hypothetical protein
MTSAPEPWLDEIPAAKPYKIGDLIEARRDIDLEYFRVTGIANGLPQCTRLGEIKGGNTPNVREALART